MTDVHLADLIQVACNEMEASQVTVRCQGREAGLYFEAGEMVHAELENLEGEEVLYEVLKWTEGSFELHPGVRATQRTLNGDSTGLLLSAWEHIEESEADPAELSEDELRQEMTRFEESLRIELGESQMDLHPGTAEEELARRLRRLAGVAGVVLVARDGAVMGENLEGAAESEAAVAVFVGNAAEEIGEALALGAFERGVVAIGGGRMLVIERPDYFVGLLLERRASPGVVNAAVGRLLR